MKKRRIKLSTKIKLAIFNWLTDGKIRIYPLSLPTPKPKVKEVEK